MSLLAAAMMPFLLQDKPRLSPLFTDNAVLQRERPLIVFGTAPAGSEGTVTLGGKTEKYVAGKDGEFRVKFPGRKVGKPFEISLNSELVASNVVVGEVWVASGQSNMEWPIAATNKQVADARNAVNQNIRCFTVTRTTLPEPTRTLRGTGWVVGNEATVGGFTAVGFWFAERLQRELNVPVGILHTSWGGTPVESWISYDALKPLETISNRLKGLEDLRKQDTTKALAEYEKQIKAYDEARADKGNDGFAKGWHAADFDDSGWKTVTVPATVESAEGRPVDGAFWFRMSFDLSEAELGDAELTLGPIDDFDQTYVNGTLVGETLASTPNHWQHPRKYKIAKSLLRSGRNVIAVRVYDQGMQGGLAGQAQDLKLNILGKSEKALAGTARYQMERELKVGPAPVAPAAAGNPWTPTSLYNGMIEPLLPFPIRGAIWYQGESNADRAEQYRELFPTMIRDWRKRWQQGDFPFLFVQLANYQTRSESPRDSTWAELREAQSLTLQVPNTGMATAIDIGERNDIHPRNKRDVGHRLAGIALAKTFRKRVPYYGPTYKSVSFQDGVATLQFDHADGLKTSDARPPVGFAVAGVDRKFVWASAEIVGKTVRVRAYGVPLPVAVRYGWDHDPDVNMVNRDNLPMFPFRTDNWPMITRNNR